MERQKMCKYIIYLSRSTKYRNSLAKKTKMELNLNNSSKICPIEEKFLRDV